MRITCSRLYTKILPSPILPVRAAPSIASIACSTMESSTAASILVLGRKSTTYSAPRYSSVWPFWRPKPLTSVTVMPCTPIVERASRTSSSLNGLMMAVTNFMEFLLEMKGGGAAAWAAPCSLERLAERDDGARLVHVAEEGLLVGALHAAVQR